MKKSLTILTAALGMIISAQAKVGDTLAESNERYGQGLPWEGIQAKAIQDLVSQGSFVSCDWSWRDRKGGIIREWFDKDHVHCNLIDYMSTEPISIDEARRLIALNLGTQVSWEREQEQLGRGYIWYGNIGSAICSAILDYVRTGDGWEGYCLGIAMH
jgi:hypothetical protein